MRSLLLLAVLTAPAAAAEFSPDHLFVARFGTGVLEYDKDGNHVQTFGVGGAGGVEFGPDGHLFVVYSGAVEEYDAEGNNVRSFTHGSLGFGFDVAFGPSGQLFLTDFNADQVLVFDRDGTFDRVFADNVTLDGAYGIAIGPDGHVWVASQNNSEIVEFDADGNVVKAFGGGFVGNPNEMTFGPDGMLYIACSTHKVFRVDPRDGSMLHQMDHNNASGITFAGDGNLRVTDNAGFVDVISFDTINGFQSLDRTTLAGSSTTAGVACGPHRFSAKLKGRFVDPLISHGVSENVTLSYTPGSGRLFIDFEEFSSFASFFVGQGPDNVDENGKWRRMLAIEMPAAPTVNGLTALTVSIQGKTKSGYFAPKKISGTLHRTQGTSTVQAKLTTKKKLK